MQNAELYARANGLQRRDTKYIIDNYVRRLFRWRSDGHESLLDIGCGSGDVTIDLVLPLLSAVTYRRLVGVDLEPSMLRFARNALAQQPDVRVAFELLDIGRPLRANELLQGGLCDWRTESFDHITSFFCLHWVHDQRQTIRNVHDLLAPSGECVLAFIAQHALYDVFFELSERPRWAPFMRDAAKWINPYQKSTSPVDEMLAHLQAAGFSESAVHLLDREYVYENEAAARGESAEYAEEVI